MPGRFVMTVGVKIYALIGLGFVGLLAVTWLDSRELGAGLLQQKKLELQHLGELALSIVKEEHAAFQQGKLTEPEAQQRAMTRVVALRYGDKDYFWIQDMQPRMVMHATKPELNGSDLTNFKDANGKAFYVAMVDVVRKDGAGYVDYWFPKPGMDQPQPKLSRVTGFAPWHWVIGTGVYINDLTAQGWASTERSLIAAGIVLLLTLAASMVVARGITTPLRQITVATTALAGGRLDLEVPGLGRRDEMGEMAGAVEIFKSNAIARQGLEAEQKAVEGRAAASRESWPTTSKARSAISSRQYLRPRRSWRHQPARCQRRRRMPRMSPPWSWPLPGKPAAMCNRSHPRPSS